MRLYISLFSFSLLPECDISRGASPEVPSILSVCDIPFLPFPGSRAGLQPLQHDRGVRRSPAHHHSLLLPYPDRDLTEVPGRQRSETDYKTGFPGKE